MNTLVTLIDGTAVTTSLLIAEGTNNEHASVIKLVRTYQREIEEFGLVRFEIRPRPEGQHGGGDVEIAILNEQQSTLLLAMMRNSEIVVRFKVSLVKAFFELAKKVSEVASVVPRSLPEALRLAADLAEQKALAEQQRDEAIRTKALICSKREATAMATASSAKRETHRLEIDLDRAKDYATVKRMEMLYHGQKFNWRLLKRAATEMGIPPIDVFDANYGTVNAYHAEVWREAYALGIESEMSQEAA